MNKKNNLTGDILVVDDTPANLKILVDTLNDAGHKTLIANSGNRALYQTAHHPPDLILLDVLMPGIDGFETCRRLKANPDTAKIPVIFMTALSEVEDKIKGFEAGGVDYITKPFQQQEVLIRVNTHLNIRHLQQQLEAQNVQLQRKNIRLKAALNQVKQLSGLLPICANCKKIRNDEGYWQQVEGYLLDHSEAEFTHGICPNCMESLYPDIYQAQKSRQQDILNALTILDQASLEEISVAINWSQSSTSNNLEIMITSKQVKRVNVDGQDFFRLP